MAEQATQEQEHKGRRAEPTEKMLKWAKTVASRCKVELTPEQEKDFDACKAFLDAHPVVPPSDAQVQYAERIAEESGADLTDGERADFKKMSAWLDANAPRH